MTNIWLTSSHSFQQYLPKISDTLNKYAININGHFWEDNLKNMSWKYVYEEIAMSDFSLWLIFLSSDEWEKFSIRYAISLLTIAVQQKKGLNFPIVILKLPEDSLNSEMLPDPMKNLEILSLSIQDIGPELISQKHKSSVLREREYHIGVHVNPIYGQWFEVGPVNSTWKKGSIFGVKGAEITFQGVGNRGVLPQECTLESPVEGIKVTTRTDEYIAWIIQNEINKDTSHFIQVKGDPSAIILGEHVEGLSGLLYVNRF